MSVRTALKFVGKGAKASGKHIWRHKKKYGTAGAIGGSYGLGRYHGKKRRSKQIRTLVND